MRKQDYSKSIRLPTVWHEQIQRFADQWQVPASYIYRQCVREFINKNIKGGNYAQL